MHMNFYRPCVFSTSIYCPERCIYFHLVVKKVEFDIFAREMLCFACSLTLTSASLRTDNVLLPISNDGIREFGVKICQTLQYTYEVLFIIGASLSTVFKFGNLSPFWFSDGGRKSSRTIVSEIACREVFQWYHHPVCQKLLEMNITVFRLNRA